MAQIINVQGIGNVAFPDGMSDDQITHAIEKDILPSAMLDQIDRDHGVTQTPDAPPAPKSDASDRQSGAAGAISTGARGVNKGLTVIFRGMRTLFKG